MLSRRSAEDSEISLGGQTPCGGGVWALETEPHHTRHEKPERRGREWEMPVFRNASLPIKQELLAFKAENEPRNKRLLCPENGCWGNHLCKG